MPAITYEPIYRATDPARGHASIFIGDVMKAARRLEVTPGPMIAYWERTTSSQRDEIHFVFHMLTQAAKYELGSAEYKAKVRAALTTMRLALFHPLDYYLSYESTTDDCMDALLDWLGVDLSTTWWKKG